VSARPAGRRQPHRSHRTSALILRRVEHGESDLVLTLFTESLGRVSALARSARKSSKRFAGALEAFQTLKLELDEPLASDLMLLREATIETPRLALTSDLERMDAAGRALGWIRVAAPPRTGEPAVWKTITELLDRLDVNEKVSARLVLAEEGFRLLAAFGWALDLEQCVRCGRKCAPGRSAMVDASRGGLVCRACGGAHQKLDGKVRGRLAAGLIDASDVDLALDLVERALRAHAGTK